MINTRIMSIVKILLEKDQYVTIDMISAQLSVSNKTIRNDLLLVDDWLNENDLKLIKKTGVGITIEGSRNAKLRILESVEEKNNALADYSPDARKIYIGLRLLSSQENCRIYELSNELYVSRATIHKDIIALSELLTTYKIQLNRKNNNGISISGKERNKRNLMLELMLRDNGYQSFMNIMKNEAYACDGSMVFAGLDLTDDEVKEFILLMTHSGNPYLNTLIFQSLIQVLLHIYVSLLRMQQKQYVHLSEEFIEELKREPFYKETHHLTDILSSHYHVEFPEMEIRYLQVYLISLQNMPSVNRQDEKEARELRDTIISSWCEQLALPFDQDQDLQDALFAHLCPAVTRYRHGIPIQNPLKNEIQKLYKHTYEIARNSILCIEDQYHCKLSEDEIGYFTLHLAAALERMKQPLKTILVCHGGIGASNLLKRKLSIQIPEIEIVAQETFISVYDCDFMGKDLIISTMELHISTELPILEISPLLYDFDIMRIKDIIKEYYRMKNDPLSRIEKEA